jgi:hypothetical protein
MDDLEELLSRGGIQPSGPRPVPATTDIDSLLSRGEVAKSPVSKPPLLTRTVPPVRGMRPEPQPDEVTADDMRVARGRDVRRALQGRQDQITTPDARQARDARAQADDPIRNDPLAGMIVQSAPAAAAGALAAGGAAAAGAAPWLARLAGGAAGGAAASPDAPLTGAALGALPGVPGAARAAKTAFNEAVLKRALEQPAPGTVAKLVGKAAGAGIGGIVGGAPGAVIGSEVGGATTGGVNAIGNKASRALAARQLARAAEGADPELVADVAARMGRPTPAVAPGGRLPVGDADIVSSRATPAQRVRAADIVSNEPVPLTRAQIARDARRFRTQPYDVDEPPADDLKALLERSIEEAKLRKAQGR